MLEWTGERYLPFIEPSICGAQIHYEHLHRYAFVAQYVKGKKVLDLASGEGYGTYILSKTADYVVGVEIDHQAVTHASNTYIKENIEFKEGSILNIPITGEKIFDVIVCFEAIEHIEDHATLFIEIKRLLKENGILIISTPNKKLYTDDAGYNNPFHVKELYYSEFSTILKKNFSHIYVFGQRVFSGSSIYPASMKATNSSSEFVISLEDSRFSFDKDDEKVPIYFIAIASNEKLNPKNIQRSYLVDKSNTEIAIFQDIIKQNSATIQSLEHTIIQKDSLLSTTAAKVQSLEHVVIQKDSQLTEITIKVQSLEQIISIKDQQLLELSDQLQSLREQVQSLREQVQSLRDENNSMKQSMTYQLTMKFHKKIIGKLFPEGTHRRRFYYLGLKGGRIFINEGLNSFWRQFKEKLLHKPIPWKKITVPSINITGIQNSDDITPIATSVSIIIPTKNAGPDFEANLEKISQQKGVQTIEIIIIDSGSTDKTLEIARKYGAKIFQIDQETFNHGTTRNFGAENAKGEYLCFLVQDAFPIGHYWLYEMVNVLNMDQQIAAATCRQIPRSDADLFACFGLWQHYTYTLDSQSDRVYEYHSDFNALPGEEKRRLAGLDDVSCLIRKIIFEKYRFRKIQSSEDLDLGKRFIQEGYKNAFLFSVGVIHSHNRDAGYFLNRSFIDTKTVSEIVGYNTQQITDNCTLSEAFGSIITLYNSLNFTLFSLGKSAFSLPTRELCIKIRSNIVNNFRYCEHNSDQNTSLLENNEHSPGDAILALTKHLDHKPEYSNINQNNLILDQYVWVINNFLGYIEIFDSIEDKKDEFIECYYKIFSVVAGASLASYYLHKSVKNDIGKELELINLELSKGV
jgi:glycosyltransferase involved in cell wall biosynthesis/SAM-dependent methyltransferase/regulator of replication initiation timing